MAANSAASSELRRGLSFRAEIRSCMVVRSAMDCRFQPGSRSSGAQFGSKTGRVADGADHHVNVGPGGLNVGQIDFERFLTGAREIANIARDADDLARNFDGSSSRGGDDQFAADGIFAGEIAARERTADDCDRRTVVAIARVEFPALHQRNSKRVKIAIINEIASADRTV